MLWSFGQGDYFLISYYLKYVPGNIYVNTTASTLAEIVAMVTSGLLFKFFGTKAAFALSYGIAALGGLLLVCFFESNIYLVAFFVLVAKFGIASVFALVYLITSTLFPT